MSFPYMYCEVEIEHHYNWKTHSVETLFMRHCHPCATLDEAKRELESELDSHKNAGHVEFARRRIRRDINYQRGATCVLLYTSRSCAMEIWKGDFEYGDKCDFGPPPVYGRCEWELWV